MESHKRSHANEKSSRIPNKKTKAVGAFRVFMNFLQKPNKKRSDDFPNVEHNKCDILLDKCTGSRRSSSSSNVDSEPVAVVAKRDASTWDRFKAWSYSGSESVVKVSSLAPEIEKRISPFDKDEDNDADNNDADDDVFLEDSYFEDDYTEDFSGSSSSSGRSSHDVCKCIDEPEPIVDDDDAFKDCFDDIEYQNNLNLMETFVKDYHKIIPEICTNNDIIQQNPEDKIINRRQRRHSFPSAITREPIRLLESLPSRRSDGNFDRISNPAVEKKDFKDLNQASKLDIDVITNTNECSVGFTVNANPSLVNLIPSESDEGPVLSDPPKQFNISSQENAGDLKSLNLNKIENENLTSCCVDSKNAFSLNYNSTIPNTKISLQSGEKPKDSSAQTFSNHLILNGENSNHDLKQRSTIHTSNKSSSSSSKKKKDEIDLNRRHSSHGSIESGYFTTSRSSGSTPIMSPIPTNHTTPLKKLHQGTPLSPHSRNTIDGIATTNTNTSSKSRPTPKRTLKPKFIFPNPSGPCVNLKPVPELGELLPLDHECHQINMSKEDGNNLKLYAENYASMQALSQNKIQDNENNFQTENTIQGPVNINVNVSVSIVDMNNNVTSARNLNGNQQSSSLSCLPVSPQQEKKLPPTPNQGPRTPQRHLISDYLNDVVISPLGKTLRPICTSSPLPNKFAQINRRNANTTPQRTAQETSRNVLPVQIHCSKTMSPLCINKTPKKVDRNRNNVQRSTSERRKRLVKRRSARARLVFDGRLMENSNHVQDELQSGEPHSPVTGDYILLKRIAESMIQHCPNREILQPCFDVPGLMDNLNSEYSKILKSHNHVPKSSPAKLSYLKHKVESSKHILSAISVENCLDVIFLSFLVQDMERVTASLDFVFENLPRVAQHHDNLSHLAPEIVMIILSNRLSIVKNNHGFPLSYVQSEKEVFRAVVKYIEAFQKKSKDKDKPGLTRVKNLLSLVADPHVLTTSSTNDKRLITHSQPDIDNASNSSQSVFKKRPRPRSVHDMIFEKSSLSTHYPSQEFLFQPFISSTVHSLDEIGIKGSKELASPISLSSISNENYILRKLYVSYRRCNNIPYITKIGMQYSHKGKKKTYFIGKSKQSHINTDTCAQESMSIGDGDLEPGGENCNSSNSVPKTSARSSPVEIGKTFDSNAIATEGNFVQEENPTEKTVVKKAAIILTAGEHITAVSVLGKHVIHNLEIVTNTGRRIRAHGLQPPTTTDANWAAIPTPIGSGSFCLHALYGDVSKSCAGRSYIRDLGVLWLSVASRSGLNDLGNSRSIV